MGDKKRTTLGSIALFAAMALAVIGPAAFLAGDRFPYAVLFLAAAVSNLALIAGVARKRYHRQVSTWFLLFLAVIAFWGLADFASTITNDPGAFEFWVRVAAGGYMFVPVFFLLFTLSFVKPKLTPPSAPLFFGLFSSALVFLYLQWTTDLVTVATFSRATLQPWGYDAPTGPLFLPFLIWFESIVIYALVRLITVFRKTTDERKHRQLRLLIIAVLIPLLGGTITNGILPILNYAVFPTAVPLTAAMSVIISYAILRYGLFVVSPASVAENVIEAMGEGLVVLDRSLSVQFANARMAGLTGRTEAELAGSSIESILTEKTLLSELKKQVAARVSAAEPFAFRQVETRITSSTGITIPVMLSISMVTDENNEIAGVILIMNDISESKQKTVTLEQSLKETQRLNKELENTKVAVFNLLEDLENEKNIIEQEKAKDEALLASIGDGVVATDVSGTIIFANAVAESLLGFKLTELIGLSLLKAVRMENNDEEPVRPEERPSRVAATTGKKTQANGYFVRKDGSKFPVAVTANPILYEEKPTGVMIVFRDITHEREIDRMKTEFISLASHQLRTPLSAIKWFSEMLSEGDAGKLSAPQKKFMDNIVLSTNRMIELVNGLLNISRIESGRLMVVPESTYLPDLVNDVVVTLKKRIEEKNLSLVVSVHPRLPKISIDPQLVREVYNNLIANAVKYTPPNGEIYVIISRKNKEIISQISDTGYGIPKKEQYRVFSKFYRGSNVIEKETSGTGLGLYLVKAIVESSAGRIWFESKENEGTTFWFSLPTSGMKAKKGEVSLNA